jgi:hypothetical protein
MSLSQKSKLPRFLKVILDIIFWMLIFVIAFLILWIIFSPILLNVSSIAITSSVPVGIGVGEEPRFEVEIPEPEAKGIHYAFVDEAQGTLRLETTDWYLVFVSNLGKLLIALGLVYVVYLLRSVLQALLQGEIFTQENVVKMRRIGYAVLVVGCILLPERC